MGVSAVLLFVLLGIGTSGVYCAHFRGGTMSWKPTGYGNEVLVVYNMGFDGFKDEYPPGGHETCMQGANLGYLLPTRGYLMCDGCQTFYSRKMNWVCTDFDAAADWDIGGFYEYVVVPNVDTKVVLYYESCCWVGPLKNAPEYTNQGYKMMTEIDLRPRLDNGEMNSSPITSPIPVQLFHSGCTYHLEIPVTDPDNDNYRCRYTEPAFDECYTPNRDKDGDICFHLGRYITIYENCTLVFDASGGSGYYAVRVMIEDLDQSGNPLSKISLSFLLKVSPDDTTCKTPTIITPPTVCRTIPVGQLYQEEIVVEAATEALYIDRIETTKPPGMTASELVSIPGNNLHKSVLLSWTPANSQIGRYTVGFNAVDKEGFSSGWSYIYLNVVAEAGLLYPVPEESDPAPGDSIDTTTNMVVRFNKEIYRPSQPAYITLLDSTGNVMDRVDTSNKKQVRFSGRDITFSMSLSNPPSGIQDYTLKLDTGVAVDRELSDCSVYSNPAKWNVSIQGAEKPATRPPPQSTPLYTPPPPPIFECTPGTTDIPPPPNAKEGDECFIHLESPQVTVVGNSMNVRYELCCSADCGDTGPPAPPGPPGYTG